MQYKIDFTKQRFAVIGLGETGKSIIRYLHYRQATIVKVFDTRNNPPNQDIIGDIPLQCGALNYDDFATIDVIVISPGISIFDEVLQRLKADGKIIVGDIELFAQAISSWDTKVIGVTGSNGKTTVTTLVGFLAESIGIKTLVAGNIGVPVLERYIEIEQTHNYPELIVLELSSFQLESIYSLKLVAATVLNISEDHLDRYRDLLEYAYYKANIFNHSQTQVLNSLDSLTLAMRREGQLAILFAGIQDNYYLENDFIIIHGKPVIDCRQLKLVGQHNYYNIMAAIALLEAAKIDTNAPQLIEALYQFNGLPHRMQVVARANGVTFIEDSKGTNVGAVIAGISGLTGKVNLILGGDGKGQDFMPLRQLVMDKCSTVAVIGKDKQLILDVLHGLNGAVEGCDSLEQAIEFCYNNARSGENIVLSPACASWDMFNDYKHRAEVFINYVKVLITRGSK
jgi:UDP-N-acetylmuramoylalanine--D-glutamate ligase